MAKEFKDFPMETGIKEITYKDSHRVKVFIFG